MYLPPAFFSDWVLDSSQDLRKVSRGIFQKKSKNWQSYRGGNISPNWVVTTILSYSTHTLIVAQVRIEQNFPPYSFVNI